MTSSTLTTLPDGTQLWFDRNGELHRDDGPAAHHPNGSQEWWQRNKLHRVDGPAVIHSDGAEWWWLWGQDITDKVHAWIGEKGLPPWREWGDDEKVAFEIRFVGGLPRRGRDLASD
ncbi:hypothetical protein [Roseococcus pinisoli]|uniref:Uncharacterized protein n=1 Tax=Roseococcus pinisoli TaxID=2835040 RepID=A0ABS5QDM9_9PROT|nr:hypothetical protein [Roseococcus pinisoli]MBS7811637.1 hypothetical protein [Roseococcus pinisoli]